MTRAPIICTELVPPPIRTRQFLVGREWTAFREGDDNVRNWGFGYSQEAAVEDLLSKERKE
jgi:hypothetical protein